MEEVRDLPVAEMLTNSREAFEFYINGDNATFFENDYEGARKHLEKAVQLDPIFASAYFELYEVYLNLGQYKPDSCEHHSDTFSFHFSLRV